MEIDSADAHVLPITKLLYLKELLELKVRATIEGLPFITEGNEWAKNILKTKYGKESEIANAHVTNIMSLPVLYGSNPNNDFGILWSNQMSPNLQAWETMRKIKEVNGYVRMMLDKFDGIRWDWCVQMTIARIGIFTSARGIAEVDYQKRTKTSRWETRQGENIPIQAIEDEKLPMQGKAFYIPHKALVQETAESMKIRIVYDALCELMRKHHPLMIV